jgi:hypothetical protein
MHSGTTRARYSTYNMKRRVEEPVRLCAGVKGPGMYHASVLCVTQMPKSGQPGICRDGCGGHRNGGGARHAPHGGVRRKRGRGRITYALCAWGVPRPKSGALGDRAGARRVGGAPNLVEEYG